MLSENELVPRKETIVRPRGDTPFHLPAGHTIELTADQRYASVSDGRNSTMYPVEKIEETDDEVIVWLGAPSGSSGPLESGWNGTAAEPTGYPLPTIGLELARLGVRWQDARLLPRFRRVAPRTLRSGGSDVTGREKYLVGARSSRRVLPEVKLEPGGAVSRAALAQKDQCFMGRGRRVGSEQRDPHVHGSHQPSLLGGRHFPSPPPAVSTARLRRTLLRAS